MTDHTKNTTTTIAALTPRRAPLAVPLRYLTVHPEREIASEKNGAARCEACDVTYAPLVLERLLSPAGLRAQRWAHSHNAARHPRRWQRGQHFQAPIPIEVRQRAACTCHEDIVCGPCMTGAVA